MTYLPTGATLENITVSDPKVTSGARQYVLLVPPDPLPDPLNMIVVFHGGGGDCLTYMGGVYGESGITAGRADYEYLYGFFNWWTYYKNPISVWPMIVVYLLGVGTGGDGTLDTDPINVAVNTSWNTQAIPQYVQGWAETNGVLDDDYVRAVITEVKTAYPAINKIAFTGHSKGALYCYYAMTQSKAVMPFDCAAIWAGSKANAGLIVPRPFLHMHGLNDQAIVWPGGGSNWPSPLSSIQEVATAAGCSNVSGTGRQMFDNSVSTRYIYTDGSVPVELELVKGIGHTPVQHFGGPYNYVANQLISFIARQFDMRHGIGYFPPAPPGPGESGYVWDSFTYSDPVWGTMHRQFIRYSTNPVPAGASLIIGLHGTGQKPYNFMTGYGWDTALAANGFTMLFPVGAYNNSGKPDATTHGGQTGSNWNANANHGADWPGSDAELLNVDDSGFLAALIAAELAANPNLDPKKVYVCGLSYGGAMTYRMGHDHAALFGSMAVMDGQWRGSDEAVPPANDVSLIAFHHVQDPTISWLNKGLPAIQDWQAFNGCNGSDVTFSTNLAATAHQFLSCDAGRDVYYWLHDTTDDLNGGSKHVWTMNSVYNSWVISTVLAFFAAHPLP